MVSSDQSHVESVYRSDWKRPGIELQCLCFQQAGNKNLKIFIKNFHEEPFIDFQNQNKTSNAHKNHT